MTTVIDAHGPVRAYLDALLTASRAVLDDGLSGFFLAGSLTLGEFDIRRSDIDIAVVVATAISQEVKAELATQLSHNVIECPARGLELVVYSEAAARSGTPEPAFEMELNDGPAMAYRFTADPMSRPRQDGTFWYAIDRDILHQAGSPLMGPSASSVFAPPSPRDLRLLLIEAMDWQRAAPRSPGADAVLGACRSRVRILTGRWHGKQQAGQLTVDAMPEWATVIRAALDARMRGTGDVAGAGNFLSVVRDEIDRP
jgi:predicted nucleotidyltransferase